MTDFFIALIIALLLIISFGLGGKLLLTRVAADVSCEHRHEYDTCVEEFIKRVRE